MQTAFCFLLMLGCALGRQGQECCSSCKSIVDCGACAREGNKCKIASGLCTPHISDSNVDCSLKTADGQPCCVFSKMSDGCECIQRRCHLHEYPSARVPAECQGRNMAGQPMWVFGCGIAFVVTISVVVILFVRRRRREKRRRHAEEGVAAAAAEEQLSEPLTKDQANHPAT